MVKRTFTMILAIGLVASSGGAQSADPSMPDRLVDACRLVVAEHPGDDVYVVTRGERIPRHQGDDAPLVALDIRQGKEPGVIFCTFGDDKGTVPVLTDLWISTCGECAIGYGVELLDRANELLRTKWNK